MGARTGSVPQILASLKDTPIIWTVEVSVAREPAVPAPLFSRCLLFGVL